MTTGPAAPASAEDRTAIFYPESDGMPLPDGEFQSPLFREIVSTLAAHLNDRPNTNVNGNTFIYYEEGNPRRFVSPDCYVAFDISLEPIERFNAYLIWEVGKSPGLCTGDRLSEHGVNRSGGETGAVRASGDYGILALRCDGRGLLRRAAGG